MDSREFLKKLNIDKDRFISIKNKKDPSIGSAVMLTSLLDEYYESKTKAKFDDMKEHFLAEKEAIRYKNDRPDGCKISFTDGFNHAINIHLRRAQTP